MSDPRIAPGRVRRLAVTIGAAIVLTTMSSSALAKGTITGFIFNSDQQTKAVAVAEDGTRYEVKVRRSGHYRIENVPAGTYEIEFTHGKTTWISEEDAVVEDDKVAVVNTSNPKAK